MSVQNAALAPVGMKKIIYSEQYMSDHGSGTWIQVSLNDTFQCRSGCIIFFNTHITKGHKSVYLDALYENRKQKFEFVKIRSHSKCLQVPEAAWGLCANAMCAFEMIPNSCNSSTHRLRLRRSIREIPDDEGLVAMNLLTFSSHLLST